MTFEEGIAELEDMLSGMDEGRLRSTLVSLARAEGPETVLRVAAVYAGRPGPDEDEVRSAVVSAIVSAGDDWAEEHIHMDDEYLEDVDYDPPIVERVCDAFSDTVALLLDAGREEDAVSMLRIISATVADPDVPWKDTPEPAMAPRRELEARILRCIGEGRPGDALRYRPRRD